MSVLLHVLFLHSLWFTFAFIAVLFLSLISVHSGGIVCDIVIGLPDLISKNLGKEERSRRGEIVCLQSDQA